MIQECPECRQPVPELARYCARCGRAVVENDRPTVDTGPGAPGLLTPPADFLPCDGSSGLFHKWESGWGGPKLLGTETQAVLLFNAGSTMADADLTISALDPNGRAVARFRPVVPELPRGEITRVEVPSYELPDDAHILTVALEHNQPAAQ